MIASFVAVTEPQEEAIVFRALHTNDGPESSPAGVSRPTGALLFFEEI
jgi:hypothetical protein